MRRTTGARTPQRPAAAAPWWVLLAAAALGLAGVLGAPAAAAHDRLESSDPADGATVTSPAAVTLTFTADQLPVGAIVEVLGPDGASWSDGDPTVEGTQVVQALQADPPAGAYTVRWRSVSGDGHPIEGELGFTVEAAEAPAPTTVPTTEPTDPVDEPTDEPSTEPSAAPTVEPTAEPPADADASALPWVLLASLIGAAAVAGAALLRARHRRDGRA